jgi:hypothetical protein
MEKWTLARLWAMDRTGATGVEVPVNRDAVLQFVLVMIFLQRTGSCKGDNPSTFPLPVNDDLQTRSSPSRIERVARSGFS